MSAAAWAGVDIGGTKTAVVLSTKPPAVARCVEFPTLPARGPQRTLDQIIEACQQVAPRRLTRSAVMRRAVEHLRTAVQEDPGKFMLENE